MFSILLLSLAMFQEPDITVDESMRVGYIMLDVSVLDQDGEPVVDLTVDDFILRENKRKVDIQVFDILDFRAQQKSAVSADQVVDPVQQTLILLLDFSMADAATVKRTFKQMESFLQGLDGRQPPQIFIFSLDKGVVSEGFTNNPLHAYDDLVVFEDKFFDDPKYTPQAVRQQSLVELETELLTCLSRERTSAGNSYARGAGLIGNCLENAHEVFTQRQVQRTRQILTVMERVMLILAQVDGLKSMYLISPGFSFQPGQAASELVEVYKSQKGSTSGRSPFQSGGVNANPGSTPEEDSDFSNLFDRIPSKLTMSRVSLDKEFARITQIAAASRVIFHTFGLSKQYQVERSPHSVSKGFSVNRAYHSFSEELSGGLGSIAEHTGGSHRMTRDLNDSLNQTLNQYRYYYVLGYPMPSTRKKKYRHIKLECRRPDVVVRHRSGYLPASQF